MTDRARLLGRVLPLVLVVGLAAAWPLEAPSWLRLATPDAGAAASMRTALDGLPEDPIVLVGFDPDIGTYAEVRPTVRGLLADLLARDARLAFVSLTPEGRALAIAELARLRRGEANLARLVDLGFVPGAEAGLVDLTRGLAPTTPDGALARTLADGGMAAVDGVAVIGGNDLGPRSWVEQVRPRVDEIPFVAVTPTILLPEVQPYVTGGQLAAVLATPRDGAAYRDGLDLGNLSRLAAERGPSTVPLLLGLLAAIAVLGQALGARVLGKVRAARGREPA